MFECLQQHLFEENKPNKKATIAKERMKPKSKSKKKSAVLTLDEYREKSKKKEAVVKVGTKNHKLPIFP